MTERLAVTDLSKSYGATAALSGVRLSVQRGEVCAILGENGAGKSTLMKILSGAEQLDHGTMFLDGQRYAPNGPFVARKSGVAMVFQELSLCPHLSVQENLLLGVEPTTWGWIDRKKMRSIAESVIAEISDETMAIAPEQRVAELPLAQQQLVEIARGLIGERKVLILDEPTSSLTAPDVQRLFALIRKVTQNGTSVLYVSHFLEEVRQITDRFMVLRDGQTVGEGSIAETTDSQLVSMMAGRPVEQLFSRRKHDAGDVVLAVDNLVGDPKPAGATLELRKGEILGLAGLMGAGRTELLRAIYGLDRVKEGKIKVKTYSGVMGPAERMTQGMGMLSEDRKSEGLALGLSIADNVTLASKEMFSTPAQRNQHALRWINELAVRCKEPGQTISELSGGNQQKIAIARLLHEDVDVLLLDEPTRGVDVASKAQIYQLLDALALKGKAILMVSSYLPELLGICDRIAVMRKGLLVDTRPVEQWSSQSILELAAGVTS